MLALTSCTGKLGAATLGAIIKHDLTPLSSLVLCTSSDIDDPRWSDLKEKGAQVRHFDFDTPNPATFAGCSKLFLVSTPRISMDYKNAPLGSGREKHHIAAIEAAQKAGVKHVYYTSLAFGPESNAGVMRAHLRTEAYFKEMKDIKDMKWIVIREGLYNESWPLYLGYYNPKSDDRNEILIAGDGKISWTSIADLGLGTALVLTDANEGKWEGKTFYLSRTDEARTLEEIAAIVGKSRGKDLKTKVVGVEEYVDTYVRRGVERASVEWWSSSYAALEKGECMIRDGILDEMLKTRAVKAKPVEETIEEMLRV